MEPDPVPVISEPKLWSQDGFEKVVTEAIRQCLLLCRDRNKKSIFTTLSGGLDSSLCLSVIRQFGPGLPIRTFTIGGNQSHPDVQFARVVADKFSTRHTEIIPSAEDIETADRKFGEFFPNVRRSEKKGDLAVFMVYEAMANAGAKAVIAHDGIDELLGGYWEHRKYQGREQEDVFRALWGELASKHLAPLQRVADHFRIFPILPYLQISVVEYISGIPVGERTSREKSKIPLRNFARKHLPLEIIERKKEGFCSGLKKF
ncbi:MAG: asparagine synthase-related protein [Candidatus Wolfebacteria bacterium]|nr:asparagine synthase-related protein [Candidatus Wolfebacteria bacterium]